MYRLIAIQTTSDLIPGLNPNWEQMAQCDGLPLLDPQLLKRHAPDAHWVLLQDQCIAGHCSLWWREVPPDPRAALGLIGHYNVRDGEAAQILLDHACEQLAQQGCAIAIAPMDGNTWRPYRLLSQRGSEPSFFLEPDNPDQWCDQFRAAGFTPLANYSSALNPHLVADPMQLDPRLSAVSDRLYHAGIRVRSLLNPQSFESELKRIHQLALISFRRNVLYTPISQAEFIAQYSRIQPYIAPELVLLAEHHGQLVGFLFAIPDLLQVKRGEPINTIIIKTVAVLPGRIYAGLGNLLVAQVQAIAHQRGYTRAIHALMHSANHSTNLSQRYAQTIRGYTLYEKRIKEKTLS